ncbi:MAG: leucine-rich repeat protein [Treponema sp.]|uniref:leucine-rich repeat protein n=1 Tax=Treponema sp. TaxID=166 RepID=UPI00298DB9DC|nr:leucine-rich repeat protein [Treponema sp.]MBR5933355.1 leucine-rich repeat protein [Treponema sp.]
MKKVFCKMALAAVLALTTLFTGCKAPSSGGGSAYNPPEKNIPLTLEAIDSGEITFNNLDRVTGLKYKINNNAPIEITENSGSKVIQISAGDVVNLFAEGTSSGGSFNQSFTINCSSDCYVYGNVMSLLTADYQTATEITQNYAFAWLFYNNSHIKNHPSKNIVLPATTLASSCYYYMFNNCSSLTQAPTLPAKALAYGCYSHMFYVCTKLTQAPSLPATTLAGYCYECMFVSCTSLTQAPALPAKALAEWCYYGMFYCCTSLTQAPVLPATTLANCCYACMFYGCTSLTQAPELLPATTLANSCYAGMFYNCSSLTQAPVLPATTLVTDCYYYMFSGCTSLNKVTCLATNLSATECTTNWLSGVASSGTFTKASGADWSVKTGYNGIPSGWTMQNK